MGISQPQDPANTLLGIYSKEAHAYNKDIFSTMFIAALCVIARTWKQPSYPSTEEWIEKCGTFTQWSTTQKKKKQWNLEIGRQMDGTRRNHPERGNPVRKRQTCYVLTHIWILDIEERITSL